jgi:hypothetical protein
VAAQQLHCGDWQIKINEELEIMSDSISWQENGRKAFPSSLDLHEGEETPPSPSQHLHDEIDRRYREMQQQPIDSTFPASIAAKVPDANHFKSTFVKGLDIDISKLTKEAEAGEGCDLQETLQLLPFEESMKVLKLIENHNADDRKTNSNLHPLYSLTGGGDFSTNADLYRAAPGSKHSWGELIFRDGLGLQNADAFGVEIGKRWGGCKSAIGGFM